MKKQEQSKKPTVLLEGPFNVRQGSHIVQYFITDAGPERIPIRTICDMVGLNPNTFKSRVSQGNKQVLNNPDILKSANPAYMRDIERHREPTGRRYKITKKERSEGQELFSWSEFRERKERLRNEMQERFHERDVQYRAALRDTVYHGGCRSSIY